MGTNLKSIRRSDTALRLVVLSDTHELHREVEVPDGDVLRYLRSETLWSSLVQPVLLRSDGVRARDSRRKLLLQIDGLSIDEPQDV
jgi:hypothetical protein